MLRMTLLAIEDGDEPVYRPVFEQFKLGFGRVNRTLARIGLEDVRFLRRDLFVRIGIGARWAAALPHHLNQIFFGGNGVAGVVLAHEQQFIELAVAR
jgi:hypothetical protein